MRPQELELRVIQIIERIESGQPSEDSREEGKAIWPSTPVADAKLARQLAAHANAAHGDPVLWLFGVDEKGKCVPGVPAEEYSNWLSRLKSFFDEGFAPDVICQINVPWKGVTVVASLFESNRAPFVVTTSQQGQVHLEVPWREGNSTRTARRRDLLRILVPSQKVPYVEITYAQMQANRRDDTLQSGKWAVRFDLDLGLYILTRDRNRITIPSHKCSFSLDLVTPTTPCYHRKIEFPLRSNESLVRGITEQLNVDGPGYGNCRCELSTGKLFIEEGRQVSLSLSLWLAEQEQAIGLNATLMWAPESEAFRQGRPTYLGGWRLSADSY